MARVIMYNKIYLKTNKNQDEVRAKEPHRSETVSVKTRATSIAARARNTSQQNCHTYRATRTVELVRNI